MKWCFSLYPELLPDFFDIEQYLQTCKSKGATSIFVNLIKIDLNHPELDRSHAFFKLSELCKKINLKIWVDINQEFLERHDLLDKSIVKIDKFFINLNVKGLRVDEFKTIDVFKKLCQLPSIMIVLNPSVSDDQLIFLVKSLPRGKSALAVFNFYPLRYSAFSLKETQAKIKLCQKLNIKTGLFVTLQHKKTIGPWQYSDRLPSLEETRDLPLLDQFRFYQVLNADFVIVADQVMEESDFNVIDQVDFEKTYFLIKSSFEWDDTTYQILTDHDIHKYRIDSNEYGIRSTLSRLKYQSNSVKPFNQKKKLQVGDVILLNDDSLNYKGEIHIVKKMMRRIHDYKIRNHVAYLNSDFEKLLLTYLTKEMSFYFKLVS